MAFFLLTSLANVTFLGLGGVALATGLLSGSPGLLLGLIPAVAAALAIAIALGARRLAGAFARRSMRARLTAGAEALGDGLDEAMRLLRTGDPAILAGASGYCTSGNLQRLRRYRRSLEGKMAAIYRGFKS